MVYHIYDCIENKRADIRLTSCVPVTMPLFFRQLHTFSQSVGEVFCNLLGVDNDACENVFIVSYHTSLHKEAAVALAQVNLTISASGCK